MKELMKSDIFSREFLSSISQMLYPSCLSLLKTNQDCQLVFNRIHLLRRCHPKTLSLLSFHIQSCCRAIRRSISSLAPHPPSSFLGASTLPFSPLLSPCLATSWKLWSAYTLIGLDPVAQVSAQTHPLPGRPTPATHQKCLHQRFHVSSLCLTGFVMFSWSETILLISLFII